MKSTHGSSASASSSCIRFSRSVVVDGLLLTSLVDWLSELSGCWAVRLRGVLKMSRSIRRWVLLSVVVISFVIVHASHPYNMVGVTVVSNNFSLDCRAYVLLVSS